MVKHFNYFNYFFFPIFSKIFLETDSIFMVIIIMAVFFNKFSRVFDYHSMIKVMKYWNRIEFSISEEICRTERSETQNVSITMKWNVVLLRYACISYVSIDDAAFHGIESLIARTARKLVMNRYVQCGHENSLPSSLISE